MTEENKGLFKHFIYVGIGTIISMIIGVVTTPIITRLYLPDAYGQYSMFITYSELVYIVLGMGMDQALARYYYDSPYDEYKNALIKKCVRFPVIVVVFLQFLIVFLTIEHASLFGIQSNAIVLIGAVYIAIQIINRFLNIILRLENRTKVLGFVGVIQKATYVIIVLVIYALFSDHNAIGLCIGALVSQVVGFMVSLWGDKAILQCKKGYNGDIVSQKELFLYAFPFVFSIIVSSVFQALDRLFIKKYCGYYEVGIYASAMSIIHIFAVIQTSFTTIWMPNAIKRFSEGNEGKEYYSEISKKMTFIMMFLGVLLIAFKDLIIFMLGEKYRDAASIIPFLVFVPIMYTISETTVVGLIFMKKSSWQILPPSIACVVNFLGNYILVPILGGKGAAISTGISYIVFLYARTILSNKFYYIDFGIKKITCITMLIIGYALEATLCGSQVASLVIGIFVLVIIAIAYKDQLRTYTQLLRKYLLK